MRTRKGVCRGSIAPPGRGQSRPTRRRPKGRGGCCPKGRGGCCPKGRGGCCPKRRGGRRPRGRTEVARNGAGEAQKGVGGAARNNAAAVARNGAVGVARKGAAGVARKGAAGAAHLDAMEIAGNGQVGSGEVGHGVSQVLVPARQRARLTAGQLRDQPEILYCRAGLPRKSGSAQSANRPRLLQQVGNRGYPDCRPGTSPHD